MKFRRTMDRKCVLTFLLLLGSGMYAQEFRATLTGTVTDPSGAAVPNANVKATNIATNSVKETKSTSDGIYTIPLLEPGSYTVEASAAGFQTLKRPDITLAVGQRLNMGLQLTVGQATTEITVTGQQEVIDTGDANKGLVFDPEKTQSYPLNGRQTYMLLNLTPGVIFTQEQFGASGFSGTRGWDVNNSYKFNGARGGNGNNVFMLNGTAISNESSTWEFAPSVDAVQEFSAMTTVYDAQYGHEAGGVVNTVIKGGTNSYHGDVYEYFRNGVLDANNFSNNVGGLAKGNHQQHQFGGVFGGPIRKDKDFFFGSYEGWQEVIPFPGGGQTVPPQDLRDGQHFTNYGMTIFDPLTTHACGAASEPCSGSDGSAYWRNAFPGNVIPQSRISPIGAKILSYFPTPTVPGQGAQGLANNFVNSANRGRYWYNQPIVRWDHTFSEKNKLYAMVTQFHGYEYRSTNTFNKPLAQGNIDNNRTFASVNLDDTHVVSPTTVLDVKLSYFRFTQYNGNYSDQARRITPASLGMLNMPHSPAVSDSVIPSITIGGFTGPVFGPTGDSTTFQPYNRWIFTPSVNMTKGKHSLHFGFEWNYETRGNLGPGPAYGAFYFGNELTSRATDRASTTNNGADTYMGIASLLLGIPYAQFGISSGTFGAPGSEGMVSNNATSYVSRPYYAGYFQDTFKVSKKLTLDIGLRYELQLAYLERYNRMSSMFDINTVNPLSDQIMAKWKTLETSYNATNPKYPYPDPPPAFYGVWRFAGQDGMPRRSHYTDYTTGAPRIGFAYRLGDKTVLRGGAGVYYQSDTNTGNGNTGFSVSTPYQDRINVDGIPMPRACFPDGNVNNNQCLSGAPTGPYSLVSPFPEGIATAPGAAAGLLANVGQSSTQNPLHWKTPRTYQYSFGIQQQLPKNMVLDVSFSGNWAQYDRTGSGWDMGHPQDALGLANQQIAMSDPAIFTNQLPNPFQGILPSNITSRGSNATVSRSSLLDYYTLWNGYTNADYPGRHFRSDALQVRFEKRAFGEGSSAGILTWVLSYTFSKQYFWDCCIGQAWQSNTGADLKLDVNAQGAVVGTLVTHPNPNGRADMYYTQYDSANKPQQIAFSGIWDLPIGHGRKFGNGVTGFADKALSGWRADYILTYISGNALGLPGPVNFCGDYVNYTDRATGQPTGQTPDHWFNNDPKCYANLPSNNINSGFPPRFTGAIENPAKPQLNFALEKNTQFKERYKVQFRAESFNLTNTPIRPGPSTSFTSATFGVLPNSQQNFPRLVQLAMKLFF
jgi:hypothetical protein